MQLYKPFIDGNIKIGSFFHSNP